MTPVASYVELPWIASEVGDCTVPTRLIDVSRVHPMGRVYSVAMTGGKLFVAMFAVVATWLCPASAIAAKITVGSFQAALNSGEVWLTGEIVTGDEARLDQALNGFPPTAAWIMVYLDSPGGDIATSMKIGRMIRRREAWTTARRCLSACLFAFVGGVNRIAFDISAKGQGLGVHRFYLAETPPSATRADIVKWRTDVKAKIAAFLMEMDVAPELLSYMEGTPPNQIKILSYDEMQRFGLVGSDPVWDEQQTARRAARFGLTSAEYRRREASSYERCRPPNAPAPTDEEFRNAGVCVAAMLYGLPKQEYLQRQVISDRVCGKYLTRGDNPRYADCSKAIMVDGKSAY